MLQFTAKTAKVIPRDDAFLVSKRTASLRYILSLSSTLAFYDKQINWTHNISKSNQENLMQDQQIFALLITRICYCTENVVKTSKVPQKMFELILLFSLD